MITSRVRKTTEAPNITRSSILLVDANVSILALVKGMLEGQGHRVLIANCAEMAMRLVAQHRLRIDYLLTNDADPNAPDLAARVLSARPKIEMLFMSAFRDPDAIRFKMIDDGAGRAA
jgi:DNA-binding NtrC family response regulator